MLRDSTAPRQHRAPIDRGTTDGVHQKRRSIENCMIQSYPQEKAVINSVFHKIDTVSIFMCKDRCLDTSKKSACSKNRLFEYTIKQRSGTFRRCKCLFFIKGGVFYTFSVLFPFSGRVVASSHSTHIFPLFPRIFALLPPPFPLFNPRFLNFVRCSRVFATPPFPNTRKRCIPIICCNRQLEYSQPAALLQLCRSFCHTATTQVYDCYAKPAADLLFPYLPPEGNPVQ